MDAGTTSYTHSGPTPGVTHEYRVRSVNAGGVSDWTDTVTATRHTGPLPPDSIIYQVRNTSRLRVAWTESASPGVTGYHLQTEEERRRMGRNRPAGKPESNHHQV